MIVGVVGAGQLARMMIPAAVQLGIELRVLAEADGMSAQLAQTAVGDYRDAATVLEFARGVDVLTFDHEHVPQDVLRAVVDAGIRVAPGPDALLFAQDKREMRRRMSELGAPQPDWAPVDSDDDLQAFLDAHGGAAILKTAKGGYDGKGVRRVTSVTDARDWIDAAVSGEGPQLLVEELVDFTRELSQQLARSIRGEIVSWPLVETVQRDSVCAEVYAPARAGAGDARKRAAEAAEIAHLIAEGVGVTGVMAVELFETADGRVVVNELAMRPHNSGHWTIEGSTTSQFEQHLRAVLDLPLGTADMVRPAAVMVNVLGGPSSGRMEDVYANALAACPDVHFHSYAKTARPGRKVGHVTAIGDDVQRVADRAGVGARFFEV
ncbi:5-(carboxyamino)imidazole ribonucleotide synthase [Agrococcus casei]|uniref:N5-carboxyaminoimidazole ribonucleotide synthase n=1 Tax=Agrococcus casei LMG 22410 TaxID=1255656 RepID=A0A1R4FE24_9MICO|nr:5-(carboxyamino)imidazole ribonucleotide synthase [Agrococcus casei]SJM54136.1 Phosphoribosylaminoimidazole carboxylase ATPase subunit [Agrococcus casei LMG 22410]